MDGRIVHHVGEIHERWTANSHRFALWEQQQTRLATLHRPDATLRKQTN